MTSTSIPARCRALQLCDGCFNRRNIHQRRHAGLKDDSHQIGFLHRHLAERLQYVVRTNQLANSVLLSGRWARLSSSDVSVCRDACRSSRSSASDLLARLLMPCDSEDSPQHQPAEHNQRPHCRRQRSRRPMWFEVFDFVRIHASILPSLSVALNQPRHHRCHSILACKQTCRSN